MFYIVNQYHVYIHLINIDSTPGFLAENIALVLFAFRVNLMALHQLEKYLNQFGGSHVIYLYYYFNRKIQCHPHKY